MTLRVPPLLSALRRNPTGAILVILQTAITLAVLVNAAGIVTRRIEQLEQPVGIDTRRTFGIDVSTLSKGFNVARAESEDLAYLRSLPGVVAAAVNVGIPLTGHGENFEDFWREPAQRGGFVNANVLRTDNNLLRTLDVPLVAGRNFRPNEIQALSPGKKTQPPAEIIATEALARALFPRGNALGRTIYDAASDPLTIIGITRNFVGDVYEFQHHVFDTALLPTPPRVGFYALLVRTQSGRREAVLRAAQRHIGAAHPLAVINKATTLAAAKREFEANNRNMALFLTTVTVLMLAVCCLGVFGLATFNVSSRTRQIGTRRAVGARKRDIVAHFMMENALILTAGTLLGSLLALAVGDWLTVHYALPRLNLADLSAGVGTLWIVGQLAAWQPARRAARIPPSVATRTI